MNTVLSLVDMTRLAVAPPQYRERSRVDLARGHVAVHAIQFSAGVSAGVALDRACRLSKSMALPVSVRVDGPFAELPDLVAKTLDHTALLPGQLEIAITGPAPGQVAIHSLLGLSAVRDMGVEVALCDFGGPRTLESCDYLPISAIILDPCLIANLPGSATATALLHAVLKKARNQTVRIVATGIESESQRALLSGLGCQQGEGTLFGTLALQRRGDASTEPNLPKH